MKKRIFSPLSNAQKAAISILRKQAFEAAKGRGAVDDDMSFESWYRAEMLDAAGVESLTDATQPLYLAIRGRFFTILGNLEQAFYDFLNAGEQNEARKNMAWRMMGQIAHLSEALEGRHERLRIITPGLAANTAEQAARNAWNYAASIAKDKFKGKRIEALNADELEQLGFTLTNRANAMQGKGNPENRNKSQQHRPKAVSKASEEPLNDRFNETDLNRELALAAEETAWAG